MKTDREKILKYLESGNTLTSLEAFRRFRTLSLQQHINVLRNRGNKIKTEFSRNERTGKRYAQYYMEG